jgi:hypothetical protein
MTHRSGFPEYNLPKWATEQLAEAALNIVVTEAGGEPIAPRETEIAAGQPPPKQVRRLGAVAVAALFF